MEKSYSPKIVLKMAVERCILHSPSGSTTDSRCFFGQLWNTLLVRLEYIKNVFSHSLLLPSLIEKIYMYMEFWTRLI